MPWRNITSIRWYKIESFTLNFPPMRDPQRIKTISELLEKAMNINPDIRFWQLLVNSIYLKQVDTSEWAAVIDPFNYEDDRIIEALTSYIEKYGTK
jgi:hypothetical protein